MRKLAALALAAVATAKTVPINNVTLSTRACQPPFDTLPFCDTSLSIDARVNDLITRLWDAQNSEGGYIITSQLTARHGGGGSPGPNDNVTSLGLPEFDWGLNCIHGVQSSCVADSTGRIVCPVSFPNPVNYGATFNKSLYHDLGAIIATETRALWLAGATEETPWSGLPHIGLDCWSPNININRDPRWGRNQEVPGEDPLLNGDFGSQYTQGIQQGEDSRYVKVAVTLKHWDAYSLENSDGYVRDNFNAIVTNYSLASTYFPAFRKSVMEGGAKGVMCSYNAVNGIPTCAHPMLSFVMRQQWGFQGYITSDTGAVEDIWAEHKYVKTEAEGACAAIAGGTTDVCSGKTYHDSLLQAVSDGLCAKSAVDAALYNTLRLRMQLGLFDPPADQPYWSVGLEQVNTTESQANNLLATLSSMVLLKNVNGALPLAPGKKIAIIGPHANAQSALVGNYLGQLCPDDSFDCVMTPFQAISNINNAAGGSTQMSPGCSINKNDTSGFAAAVALAQASDIVILALGIDGTIEGESHDRTSIDLPYIQHQLAAAITAVGKPTVLVLVNGGSLDISPEKANPTIGGIVEAFYPGTRGSEAIAATLFGQNDHLGGKMPYTVYYANYTSLIKMSDMELDGSVGRGYRFYTGPLIYPFGYGLTLSPFTLSLASGPSNGVTLRTEAVPSKNVTYTVLVKNAGSTYTSDEVVQVYFAPVSTPTQPASKLVKQLVGYERVHLAPGQSTTVSFTFDSSTFRMYDKATGNIISAPGSFNLVFTNGNDQTLTYPLTINGNQVTVKQFPY